MAHTYNQEAADNLSSLNTTRSQTSYTVSKTSEEGFIMNMLIMLQKLEGSSLDIRGLNPGLSRVHNKPKQSHLHFAIRVTASGGERNDHKFLDDTF